jgi:hypothetical protein
VHTHLSCANTSDPVLPVAPVTSTAGRACDVDAAATMARSDETSILLAWRVLGDCDDVDINTNSVHSMFQFHLVGVLL